MIWKILLPVLVASMLGWGAWTTVATTSATPRSEFEKHEQDNRDKFWEVQQIIQDRSDRIEDKLDKIQEKL
jgi:hypothetical protein